ncbi:MAG: UvrD-helicase domain-containing protein, partial [Myxococcota bacterium]
MLDPIVAEELELLEKVSHRIAEMDDPVIADEAPIVEELKSIRERLLDGSEAKDTLALTQQWHRQSALLAQLRSARGAPQIDPGSPYFAHLRLQEGDQIRDLCVGRATCIDGGVRVVDWRNAPISRIFYRYQQGENFEEKLADRVRTGVVVARRTVNIGDGILDRVEAPEGIFALNQNQPEGWQRIERDPPRLIGGESSAVRAHGLDEDAPARLGTERAGARLDKRLPEITGLIDPEQFGLITRPSAGFLAIRGTTGSGKTTVALHRIAYLAYADSRIDSDQTLVAVFSPALRNFVSHVLPSLGLGHVRISTFSDWAIQQRRRHFPQLPRGVRDDAPVIVQRIKLHPMFGTALRKQVERVSGASNSIQAIDDWASATTNLALLEETNRSEIRPAFSNDDLQRFVEWNRRHNEELFARLDGDSHNRAELCPEDDALLLRAWQLRAGPLRLRGKRPIRYRHIAIDEVQDFAPIEVQVLLDCLDRSRSITLAGDTQQHIIENSGFTSWSEFLSRLGIPGTAIETLRISYRSTQQILEFALSLLGDL